jgi:benzoyl-CoA reductase/2-hydroxyglutaryl-CoA dehydratase subunit BcrC/BadD/HgdB
MNAVAYSSPFVPAEWIAAHGLQACRLRLHATEKLTRGICPYAGALMEAVPAQRGCDCVAGGDSSRRLQVKNAAKSATEVASYSEFPEQSQPKSVGTREFSAFVLTTICDQMRYAAAILQQRGGCPIFLMNVPSTWQTPTARQLYLDELQRLGRFLVRLGGNAPSDADLSQTMLEFERARMETRGSNSRRPTAGEERAGIPLAIVGGPLMEGDGEFFDLVERAGGRVVLDATEEGERSLPRQFDARRLVSNPLEELADAYFDGITDAFRRPDSRLYEWFARELASRQVRGIILRRYLWCDLWHAALPRLKQWSSMPVLEIDVGPDDLSSPNRMQGRIEAFLETLW